MPTSDAPALNPDGTLKDASEIEWLDSPSDENRTVSLKKKDDHNGSDKDGDGGGCDERSEPKDPLVEYEKMREYIQHECMVHAHTFLLSSHTHIEWQPTRKHSHRGQDLRTQDLHAMFTPGKIKNQATKEAKKGHFCHACM